MGHLNSAWHKANHGGYKKKPTQASVKANLSFWAELNNISGKEMVVVLAAPGKGTPKIGTQLSLF